LRIFALDLDPEAISEKKLCKRINLFKEGELDRLVLGVLRKAGKPLSTEEVTACDSGE
jgi:hypothetical protein